MKIINLAKLPLALMLCLPFSTGYTAACAIGEPPCSECVPNNTSGCASGPNCCGDGESHGCNCTSTTTNPQTGETVCTNCSW
ncbi:hypothetical protein [Legionella sp. km772]|uniref:hypothetical protein n=1 Tax=Legionella sp. km772 TaxID=2498111 RepID=UPI000F8CC03D|nr:hypothetical protein [Legionella sp. km772]RUR11004.1 hypothetical protein ELY15_07560 [Legionella sp. km772]